jgi:hypothetical protein
VGHALIDGLVALAALVAILDYFGLKPREPIWGLTMPLSKNWKLAIMLGLVAASLGMSSYGFYRSYQPKIVEKTVEKPVEKVVEKLVPQECPLNPIPSRQHFNRQSKTLPQPTVLRGTPVTKTDAPNQPPIQQDCGGGNCAASVGQQGGITAGQVNVNGPIPPVYTFTEEVVASDNRKKINVHIHADRAVRGAIVGMLFSGPIDYVAANNPNVTNAGMSQQNWGQLNQKNGIPLPNSLYITINSPTVFLPSQELIVPVTSAAEVHVLKVFPVED